MTGGGPVAAIDVGGSSIKSAVVFEDGLTQFESSVPVVRDRPDQTIRDVRRVAMQLVESTKRGLPVRAVGLVVPGVVDPVRGVGVSSMLLGWRDVAFVDLLSAATGLPVGFGHDVIAAATVEGELGQAKGNADWLYLALGTGLGSCFMLNGRAYRGAHGIGGELAHIVAIEDGVPCRCGKTGCAEMYFSGSAFSERMQDRSGREVTAEQLVDLARGGDPEAIEVWSQGVRALATVVAHQVEMLDPGLIVVGGGLAESGSFLLDALDRQLTKRVTFVPRPRVVPGMFGPRAGLMGAALLARSQGVER